MKFKIIKTTIIILEVVLFSLILSGCKNTEPVVHDPVKHQVVEEINNLAKIQDFDGITVSVYWREPTAESPAPLTAQNLIDWTTTKTFTLEGDEIEGRLDLFDEFTEKDIEIIDGERNINARFYILIESEEEGKLFDLLMFENWTNFVLNDTLIKPNEKIVEMILPLLDSDGRFDLRRYINEQNPF